LLRAKCLQAGPRPKRLGSQLLICGELFVPVCD